jgi:hypothetical protein
LAPRSDCGRIQDRRHTGGGQHGDSERLSELRKKGRDRSHPDLGQCKMEPLRVGEAMSAEASDGRRTPKKPRGVSRVTCKWSRSTGAGVDSARQDQCEHMRVISNAGHWVLHDSSLGAQMDQQVGQRAEGTLASAEVRGRGANVVDADGGGRRMAQAAHGRAR